VLSGCSDVRALLQPHVGGAFLPVYYASVCLESGARLMQPREPARPPAAIVARHSKLFGQAEAEAWARMAPALLLHRRNPDGWAMPRAKSCREGAAPARDSNSVELASVSARRPQYRGWANCARCLGVSCVENGNRGRLGAATAPLPHCPTAPLPLGRRSRKQRPVVMPRSRVEHGRL
jgi:hypothetical protein